VVFDNAAQSVLPSLVQKDLLPKANGTLYVVQVIGGSFLGPPVGIVVRWLSQHRLLAASLAAW
jgi:hypothetical protein